jgi:hydroxymethylpyrimidine pyrophosphatase-like HAD family hydrolase
LFDLFGELREKGVLWAINTGRAVHHIVEGLEEFGFPFQPDFIVTSERDVFRRNERGSGWENYGDWNERCMRAHDELFDEAKPILQEIHFFLKKHTNALPINDISGIGLVASSEEEMERIADFIDSLRPRLPAFHYQRNTRYMRFCHSDYSKGTALGELGRLLGVTREEIFAAGDHYNDIPMLDGMFARWVACPANSAEAVKQTVIKANGYVAGSSCSEGVVESLRHFSKQ